jgi:hypothetical protein
MRTVRTHTRLLVVAAMVLTLGATIVVTEEPLTGAAAAADAASAQGAAAGAATERATRLTLRRGKRARLRATRGVEFGIYPGGGAGAVNGRGEPRPEIAALRQQALTNLQGDPTRPFAVHLYDAYTRPADAAAIPAWLADQIAGYSAAGMRIELVLRYRPNAAPDIAGFTAFVKQRVAQLGPNRQVVSLQITNEANVPGAPDAADGAYAGASTALVRGVIAARHEARRLGHDQLAIGFNVADEAPARALPFFTGLRRTGGRAFARSVDWVGIDAYPGTWGPALPNGSLDRAVRTATRRTVDTLRRQLLPAAGLPRTPIIFAESGYPTDHAQRTEAQQAVALRAAVETVVQLRRSRGVIGYRWFDLRDADSSVPSFESQYGLTRDDYAPKAAFGVYRSLIAQHG